MLRQPRSQYRHPVSFYVAPAPLDGEALFYARRLLWNARARLGFDELPRALVENEVEREIVFRGLHFSRLPKSMLM